MIELRALLAELYQHESSIRRVLYDAGMDPARIQWNASPLDIWDAVLTKAEKTGKIADLLGIVKLEYGANPRFQSIYRTYLQAAAPTSTEQQTDPPTPRGLAKGLTRLRQRPAILLGTLVLAIMLLGASWLAVDKLRPSSAQPLCPTDRHCLLVADFAPADDPLAAELSRKLKTKLDSQLSPSIFAARQTGAVADAAAAQQLANQEKALVVVWGEIFSQSKELQIFFALTDQFGIGESHQVRPYRAEFFEAMAQQLQCQQHCFEDVTARGAAVDQISTVAAYTAAGLLHYANDQPEVANQEFTAALLCSGAPTDLPLMDAAIMPTNPVTVSSTLTAAIDVPSCATAQPIMGFNPASIYYYAGKAKILVGNYATAIAYLQHAAALNPKDPAALIAIATAYQSWLNQSDAVQAQAALAQARQRTNTRRAELGSLNVPQQVATIEYELGLIAELAGDLKTAQEKYAAAADSFGRRSPAAYVSLLALGRAQRMAGQIDAAIDTLQQALALDETVPWAYLELAQLYGADRAKSETQLQAAREVTPNQSAIAVTEAALCEQWQDYVCAEAAYARAVEQRPTSGWLQGRIGDFYRLREDWQQAATHYEAAVQLRPNDVWAHDRLAFAYLQLGNYAEAATHYALTLDLAHPQNRVAERYCALGQAQDLAGEPQAALGNYRLCVDGLTDEAQRTMVEEWIGAITEAQDSQ